MAARLPVVHNAQEIEALVMDIGFLPFVPCGIDGFSLKDCTPPGHWFVRDVKGPWEWREEVAERGTILYGKLFARKAGFISPLWFADLANWRRGGMDFDDRYADGLIGRSEKQIMDLVRKNGPMRSRDLRAAVDKKGFEGALISLQMRTDLIVQQFEYKRDAMGQPYGMGVTRLARPESLMDEFLLRARMEDAPKASYDRLAGQVRALFPGASEKSIERLLR